MYKVHFVKVSLLSFNKYINTCLMININVMAGITKMGKKIHYFVVTYILSLPNSECFLI
jgi:hypothetical protein